MDHMGRGIPLERTSGIIDPNQAKSQEQPKPDADMFVPITPKRTADQEYRMESRKSKAKAAQ